MTGPVVAMLACAATVGAGAAVLAADDLVAVARVGFARQAVWAVSIGAAVSLLTALAYLLLGPLRRWRAQDAEQARWWALNDDLLRAMPDGFFLIGADGVIHDPISPAVLQVLKRKLWPGMDLIEVLQPMLAAEALEATSAYLKLLFGPKGREHRLSARNPVAELVSPGPPSKQLQLGLRFERIERDGAVPYLLVIVSDIGERVRLSKALSGASLRLRAQLDGVTRVLARDSRRIHACLDRNEAALERLRVRLQRLSAAGGAVERKASYHALLTEAQSLKREAGEIDLDLIETPAHCLELDLLETSERDHYRHEDGRRLAAHVEHLAERIGTMRELLRVVDRRPAAAGAAQRSSESVDVATAGGAAQIAATGESGAAAGVVSDRVSSRVAAAASTAATRSGEAAAGESLSRLAPPRIVATVDAAASALPPAPPPLPFPPRAPSAAADAPTPATTRDPAIAVVSPRAHAIATAWSSTGEDIRDMAERGRASASAQAAAAKSATATDTDNANGNDKDAAGVRRADERAARVEIVESSQRPSVDASAANPGESSPQANDAAATARSRTAPETIAGKVTATATAVVGRRGDDLPSVPHGHHGDDPFALLPLLAWSGDAVLPPSKAAFVEWSTHARGLAGRQGKSVRVEAVLDLFELLPMTSIGILREVGLQLVDNAVNHGIESMSMRRRIGKDPVGVVRLSLSCDEDGLWQFSARDDGRGINLVRLRTALLREGRYRLDEIGRMNESEVILKIFEPGVTTAASSDGDSGLGLGLSRVLERIDGLGARMSMATVPGKHTEFRMRWTQP